MKIMEEQMTEARRIWHEINNVLAGILGHTQLLRLHGQLSDKDRERVYKIEELAHRLREIAAQIKDN